MEKEAVLPKNVRQIGDIQGNRRIYMEDYVMTYIHRKEKQEEQGFLGVFLGERQETEEGTLVFIRGLVEVPDEGTAEQNGRFFKKRKEMHAVRADAEQNGKETEEEPQEEAAAERHGSMRARGTEKTGKPKEAREAGPNDLSGKDAGETAWESSGAGTEKKETFLDTEEFSDAEDFSDAGEVSEYGGKAGEPEKRTVLEECREFFGPSEIQGCCVIGEYPVKRMEHLAEEVPQSRRFLYHLQEQEETLYWAEAEKYEQISGYFVFYEQNKEMQEYMAEMFEEEGSEQAAVSDKAIKNFRAKIRKKDQIRLNGMLKLASSFFAVAVLLVGAVVVNRMEKRRGENIMAEVPENEAQSQLLSDSAVMMYSGTGGNQTAGDGTDAGGIAALISSAGISQMEGTGSDGAVVTSGAVSDSAAADGAVAVNSGAVSDPESGAGPDAGGNAADASGTVPAQEPGAGTEAGGTAANASSVGADQISGEGTGTVSDSAAGEGTAAANSGAVSDPEPGVGPDAGGTAADASDTGEGQISGNGTVADGSAEVTSRIVSDSAAGEGTAAANSGAVTVPELGAGPDAGGTAADASGTGADQISGEGTVTVSNPAAGEGTVAVNSGTVTASELGTGTDEGGSAAGASGAGTDQISGSGAVQDGAAEVFAENEGASVEAAARQMRASYVIREGDTLADICQTYYGGLDKLELICEANGIKDANMIMPGQKIVLP